MADDNDIKNRSRKKLQEINTLPSRVTERIYDIYTESSTKTKTQLDLESRLERVQEARERASRSVELARRTGDDQLEVYRRQHQRLAEREAKTREQIESEEINRRENARRISSRYVGISLSPERLERQVNKLGGSTDARFLGRDMAQQMSQSELETRARQNLEHTQQTASQIMALSKDIDDPRSAAKIQGLIRTLGRQQAYGGMVSAAINTQREMGLDERSVQGKASSISEKINRELMAEGVRSDVRSGNVRSYKEEMDEYRKLREAVKNTADEIKSLGEAGVDLRKQQEEQISAYEKQKQVVKEMQAAGMGGGGGMTTADKIGLAGRGISAISGVGYHALVGSEIEQTRARTGLAAVMNQQFFNQQNALSGDMSSLLISSSGIDAAMLQRAETMRTRARAGAIGSTAGGASQAIGTAIAQGSARDVGGAINTVVSGVETTAKNAIDISKGIPQTNAAVDAYGAGMGLSQEVIKIRAQSLQAFYNDRMAAYQAATGTGALSSTLMEEMTNPALASKLGNIDLNRQKNLFSMGANQVGISFMQSAENRERILTSAASAERRGLISAEQYMSNLGKITAAGGSQKDFEDAMASAVARGVSDSASIGRMVEAMTNLSQMADQGKGMSGTAAAAQAFGLGLDTFQGTGFDQRQREQNVMKGLASFQEMTGGTGMDLGTVSQIAELKKMFPEMSGAGLQNVAGLGTEGAADLLGTLREYESADPNRKKDIERIIREKGVSEALFDKNGKLRKDYLQVGKDIFKSELNSVKPGVRSRGGAVAAEEYEDVLSGRKSFSEISGKTTSILSGLNITESSLAAQEGRLAGRVPVTTGGTGVDDKTKGIRDQTATAMEISTQAAIKNINAFGYTMEEVVQRMQKVFADFDPQKSFAKTVGAAGEMHLDVKGFNTAADTFERAVAVFAKTQGIAMPETPQPSLDQNSNAGGSPLLPIRGGRIPGF
jgi:hypothetical protein